MKLSIFYPVGVSLLTDAGFIALARSCHKLEMMDLEVKLVSCQTKVIFNPKHLKPLRIKAKTQPKHRHRRQGIALLQCNVFKG